jgi:hypothetical protein
MPLGLCSSIRLISVLGLRLCRVNRRLGKDRFRLGRGSNNLFSMGMFRLVSTSGRLRYLSSSLSLLRNLQSQLPWFLLRAQLWGVGGARGFCGFSGGSRFANSQSEEGLVLEVCGPYN